MKKKMRLILTLILTLVLVPASVSCGGQKTISSWNNFTATEGKGEMYGSFRGTLWTAEVSFSPVTQTVTLTFSEPAALSGCCIVCDLATGNYALTKDNVRFSLLTENADGDSNLWETVASVWRENSVLSVTEESLTGEGAPTDCKIAGATKLIRLANGMAVRFDVAAGYPLSVSFPQNEENTTCEVKFRNWLLTNGEN